MNRRNVLNTVQKALNVRRAFFKSLKNIKKQRDTIHKQTLKVIRAKKTEKYDR